VSARKDGIFMTKSDASIAREDSPVKERLPIQNYATKAILVRQEKRTLVLLFALKQE
jgi:hypothetical protein